MDPLLQRMDYLVALMDGLLNTEGKYTKKPKKPKQQKKQKKGMEPLQFIDVGAYSKLAMSHCPSDALMERWHSERGVSDIVTLLRMDEPKCTKIGDKCKSLGLEWHHFPISGAKRFCASIPENGVFAAPPSRDLQSLMDLKQIINALKSEEEPRSVVVHCAAGQHRTGLTAYLILRGIGFDKEGALKEIERVRTVTFKEMVKERRPNTWFQSAKIKNFVHFCEAFIKSTNWCHS